MLIISFDALGNHELDQLSKFPTLSTFMKRAKVFREIPSLLVTNTYPIHASISTGVTPDIHGITSNMEPFPKLFQKWSEDERGLRVKTLWQAAKEKGIETAAVLWPVTAFSKAIKYNIPEMHKQPGKSQLLTNLKAGSKLLQLKLLMRYKKQLDGVKQPKLDEFSTSCMVDILRKYNPGLALMHLTAYDSLCHIHGRYSKELEVAYKSIDSNLSRLLDAVEDERDVIIFSDHSQINVHTAINPNEMLVRAGLLHFRDNKYIMGDDACFFECSGGTSFFHAGTLSQDKIEEIRNRVAEIKGFLRFLSNDEMSISGQRSAFGVGAKAGYYFESFKPKHKATHGFTLDMPDYTVFYMYRFKGDSMQNDEDLGKSLLEITSLASKRLGLKM